VGLGSDAFGLALLASGGALLLVAFVVVVWAIREGRRTAPVRDAWE